MIYKIVKDQAGNIVAFGPNDDNYVPGMPVGGSLEIVDILPVMPVYVPSEVSMRQARAALIKQGFFVLIDTAIAGMPGIEGELARNDWEFAQTVRRDSALVANVSSSLGWDDAKVSELFTLAGGL